MPKQKSLKLNFIMNMLLTMSSFIFPLITFPYVSRILLPEGTGKVSFATSLISYFAMFAQLGIPTYGIRACAGVRDDKEKLTKTVHELFIINAVMSVVSYLILFILLFTVPKLQTERTLYLIVSLTILFNLVGMEWLFKGLEQYTYITVRSVIFKFIALILMFVFVHVKSDYVIYGGITIFAASAAHIMNFFYARKFISFKIQKQYEFQKHLKAVAVFFAMACAATIYTHLDTVMLGLMKTDDDVGYYNAAVKIKSILVSIVTSLGTVLLPRASYYVKQGKMEEFRRISAKALNFVFLLASPLMLYFILFAKQGIYFLSGEAYTGSILPMQIIMPTLLFIGITNILGIQILVPLGRERTVLYSEIAGAITDLTLNAVLIPKYASSGAAIGTVVAEFVVFLVQFFALRKEIISAFAKIQYYKILLGMALGTASCMWVPSLGNGNFITLLISACLFFIVYGSILLILKEPLTTQIVQQFIEKYILKNGIALHSERNINLDFAKVIACIAVVGLHTLKSDISVLNSIFYYLCGFAIPIFFMSSGYILVNREKIAEKKILKKIGNILLLTVIWSAFIQIGKVLYYIFIKKQAFSVLDCVISLVSGLVQKGVMFHFWYLGALVLLYLFYMLLFRTGWIKHSAIIWGIAFAVSIVLQIFSYIREEPIQKEVIQTFRQWTWIQYFMLGGLTAKWMPKIKTYSFTLHIILVILISAVIPFYQLMMSTRIHEAHAEFFYDDILTILWAVLLFTLFMRISLSEKSKKIISVLSPLTMGVYIMHVLVIKGFVHFFPLNSFQNSLIAWCGVLCLSFIGTWICSKLPVVNKLIKL